MLETPDRPVDPDELSEPARGMYVKAALYRLARCGAATAATASRLGRGGRGWRHVMTNGGEVSAPPPGAAEPRQRDFLHRVVVCSLGLAGGGSKCSQPHAPRTSH